MIQFVKRKILFLTIGSITVISAILIIGVFGLKPGIDFTGGSISEVTSSSVNEDEFMSKIRDSFAAKEIEVSSIQRSGDSNVLIKSKELSQEVWGEIQSNIGETYDDVTEVSFETIGPTLGQELLRKTGFAVVVAALSLLVYIAWRFENKMYGITAVMAMVHDVLVILASFALFGYFWGVEIDVMFVTAALTALAFSVHDTVVLYDRVHEVLRRNPKDSFGEVVNTAVNATLVRSLSTSLTIVLVLTSLLVLGGDNIRWFVVALLVGTITGAYSSPFIAAPLVVWLEERQSKEK